MRKAILATILSMFMFSTAYAGEFSDSAAGIENQLDSLESSITALQNQVNQLPTNLDDIQASLNSLSASVDSLNSQIDVLLGNDSELRTQTQDLQNSIFEMGVGLGDLAGRIDEIEIQINDHTSNHPSGGDDGNPNLLPIQPLVLSPTDDAYVRGGIHADSNFGSSANLIVKSQIEGDFIRYSYLKFDLSGIRRPVDSTLLRVYAFSIQQNMTIELYDTSDMWNWTEDTITWNTKPSLGTQLAVSAPLKDEAYVVWDLTSYINSRPTQTQFTFALISGGEAQASRNDFYSKESLINQPEISFVWQEQGAMIDAGNCYMYVGDRVEDIRKGYKGTITEKKCLTLSMIASWHSESKRGQNIGYQTVDLTQLPTWGLIRPWPRPIGIYKVKWDAGTVDSSGNVPYGGNNGYNLCPEGLCGEQCNYRAWDDHATHETSRCRGHPRYIWTPQAAIYQVADLPAGSTTNPLP